MSEDSDLKDEMKRLKEEMHALKQQLHDIATQSSDAERKRRGIHIDINGQLAGISDYVAEVMEGVNEGIRGELEKSIFIHPRRGEVIIHRDHKRRTPPEHIEKPDLTKAANIMSALGQEHRLKILSELMTGGKYISDLQTALPEITASTLSSHLDVLQEAGLVVQERVRGRYLVTIPGRIAYKMAAAAARQRETPHGFGYTYRTEHDDSEDEEKEDEDEDDDNENEKEE